MGAPQNQSGQYADDNAPWIQQTQETEQIVLHPGSTPWYFAEDFSWWWTGFALPIILAWIVNRSIKHKRNNNKNIPSPEK